MSEIHENVDLVLGIKNIFELEGVINSHNTCFSFLNRSIPFFPMTKTETPPQNSKDDDCGSSICRGIVGNGHYKGIGHHPTLH